MTAEERIKIVGLIKQYCQPSRYYYRRSSYALKEVFEQLAECYISNEEFKAMMQEAGFSPTTRRNGINHCYKLTVKDSPEINIYFRGNGGEAYKYKK